MDAASMIPAGESFVSSFADMTRSMMAQSRGLARKVSLAQLLEDANYTNRNGDDKENRNGATNAARNPLHGKVIKDLRSLEAIVSGLERRVAEMRDAIDQERRGNTATRGMSETTRQQTAQLAATSNSLPEHLPFPAPPPTVEAASTAISGSIGPTKFVESEISAQEDSAAREEHACRVAVSEVPAVPILDLVTMVELEKVPRSTRSRLTIAQVNGAVAEIQNTMERRHTFFSKPRNKMSEKQRRCYEVLKQQEVPAHGGAPFISEADLRALPTFKKGEVTAKALIATLRNLKRLKGVRAAGMMTYVVQEG